MSDNVIQSSFSIGELSPSLFARVDFAKYRSGAATMRNFFVDYRSGASTRTGTEFIRPTLTPKVRLIRFQQSQTVTFILEFGGGYLRFISNGGSVVKPATAITGVTTGAVTRIDIPGTSAVAGSTVFVSGVAGQPQINNRYFTIQNQVGTTFQIYDATTNLAVDSTTWGPYGGGGFVQEVYTIGTPWTADELRMMKFSQNASIMNITHPNHPPYKLQLFSATNWVLSPVTVGATVGPPPSLVGGSSFPGSAQYKYAVTTVDDQGQESTPIIGGLSSVADLRVTQGTHQISWDPALGAAGYNIYGSGPFYTPLDITNQGGLGLIGSVPNNVFAFNDSNAQPDFQQTPPVHDDPFFGGTIHPQVSSYFQQRLCYGNGGGNLIQTFWMSKTGAPYNFDISQPIQANDAITGTLVSLEVNEIKSMVPMPSGLIMLTTKGAWQVSGGGGGVGNQGGPITPTTMAATPQAYVGANDVPPIVINYDLIFIQSKGSIVRDLTYNIYANIYTGNDISILANHLFYDHQILEWAYAEEPYKIVWCVRDDGILLSLTLVKEQDMYGWARHDTRGNFMSVASVTEGQFDATYFAVVRPHPTDPNGVVTVIERLADRTFPFGAEDAWCVDFGVRTASNTPNANLLIIQFGPPGEYIFIIDQPFFDPSFGTWILRAGGGIFQVHTWVSVTQMKGTVIRPVTETIPDDPLNRPKRQPPGKWSVDPPLTTMYGLDHLEGQEVAVLADGGVVNGLVVHNGSITLPHAASKVVVGLGFQAQLQTMPLDLGNEANTIQGKRKKVGALTVRVKDSRGLKAGRTFETVTPIKELNRVTMMGQPINLVTGDERIVMDPLWDVPGQLCMQVDDPLPSSVLGVIPEVVIGDTPK